MGMPFITLSPKTNHVMPGHQKFQRREFFLSKEAHKKAKRLAYSITGRKFCRFKMLVRGEGSIVGTPLSRLSITFN